MLGTLSVIVQASLILSVSGFLFAYLLRQRDGVWVRGRLLPIMIGLFAFAMLLPNRWLIYVALIAIIPALSRSRADIPPIYAVVALALPQLSTPIAVGGIYLLDFDKWLMTAIGAVIAFAMHPPVKNPVVGTRFDLPFFLFIALEAVQARGLNFTSILRLETSIILSILLPYWVISRSLSRPEDVRRLMLALVFVAFVFSGIAIYESRRGVLLYNILSQRVGIVESLSSYAHTRGGNLRATASFFEATSFGAFLCTGFLGALALRDAFRTKQRQTLALIMIILGIYMANTRTALMGLVIGTLAFDLFRKRWGLLARNTAIFASIGIVALALAQVSSSVAARLGLAAESAGTTDYRRLLLVRGWEEIQKHPLLGVSSQQAYLALSDLRQGEGIVDFVNAYIFSGLTAGIGGMVAMLLGFILCPIKLVTIRKRLSRFAEGRELGASVFAVCMFGAVGAAASGFGGRAAMTFYLFLAMGSTLCGLRMARPPVASAHPDGGAPVPSAPALHGPPLPNPS